jgi:hypothetical protein
MCGCHINARIGRDQNPDMKEHDHKSDGTGAGLNRLLNFARATPLVAAVRAHVLPSPVRPFTTLRAVPDEILLPASTRLPMNIGRSHQNVWVEGVKVVVPIATHKTIDGLLIIVLW